MIGVQDLYRRGHLEPLKTLLAESADTLLEHLRVFRRDRRNFRSNHLPGDRIRLRKHGHVPDIFELQQDILDLGGMNTLINSDLRPTMRT